MPRQEFTESDDNLLASVEGTLEEHNEGREVQFVLVCINRPEKEHEDDEPTRVEVIGNMPPAMVRHTLTKTLMALIAEDIDDIHDHVCDDCKDKAH